MRFGLGKKHEPAPLDPSRFDAFHRTLPGDPDCLGPATGWSDRDTRDLLGRDVPAFSAFLAAHARSSVGGGALRFLLPDTDPSLLTWNRRDGWQADWPSTQPAVVFASDWMGRLFLALKKVRGFNGEPALGLLVPATGESLLLEYSFEELVCDLLPSRWREILEIDRLDAWRAAGNETPRFDEAVGPKQPLFLGGSDEIADLEISSLVVTIAFGGQLWEQAKDLPEGTIIERISID